jgi:hypothetical protein
MVAYTPTPGRVTTMTQGGLLTNARDVLHRRLGFSEKAHIDLPDVDEALDIGYSYHVADDALLRDTAVQSLALRIVRDFEAIEVEANTPDHAYLVSVRGVVLTYARGLTRRKAEWLGEVERAKEEHERALSFRREATRRTIGLLAVWRYVGASVLALAGYLFGTVLSVVVPHAVAVKTGKDLPAILIGLLFIAAGMAMSFYWRERKRDGIEKTLALHLAHAKERYDQGRLREYIRCRLRLAEAWKSYGGEDYPERLSYQHIMESDMHSRRLIESKHVSRRWGLLRYAHSARRVIQYVRHHPASTAS